MGDRARITALNGGAEIYGSNPPLDTPEEVWFYVPGDFHPGLRIWSRGALVEPAAAFPTAPVTRREALYKLLEELFVEIEVRGDQAIVRRGNLNGAMVGSIAPAATVDDLLAWYRGLGFADGTPWHATKTKVTQRIFLKRPEVVTAWLDGNVVYYAPRDQPGEVLPHPTREAAIAELEKRLQVLAEKQFTVFKIELAKAREPNPPIGKPKAAKAAKAPARKAAKPKDAFEAVDAAIALLADLHARYPRGHLVVECLKSDDPRLAEVGHDGDFFKGLHTHRFDRWSRQAQEPGPKPGESSFAYFARRYGSITWILQPGLDCAAQGSHVDEVSGGGYSPLQIDAAGTYDALEDMAEAEGKPELLKLLVFHGGWHFGRSFALDTRFASPAGEHPVIPFDESEPVLPKAAPKKIQPFGDWLFAHAKRIAKQVEEALEEVA